MKRIPLSQGKFALVDDEDFEMLNRHRWCAGWNTDTKSFYAVRSSRRDANGKQKSIKMHRVILNIIGCFEVDHINHDTLDNRRKNLRLCTGSQNNANRRLGHQNTSGFKGVDWNSQRGKWRARLMIKGKRLWLGHFSTSIEAALAYDRESIKRFGDFALTNKKLGLIP